MEASSSSVAAAEGFVVMDDRKNTTESYHFLAHGDTWIDVIYTNEASTIDRIILELEGLLEKEQRKFVGLDLEYDRDHKKCGVMQIDRKSVV